MELVPHQHHITCLRQGWDYIAMGLRCNGTTSHVCEMGDTEDPEDGLFSHPVTDAETKPKPMESSHESGFSLERFVLTPTNARFPPKARVIVLVNTLLSTCISLLSVLQKLASAPSHTAFVWSEEYLCISLNYVNSRKLEEANMARYYPF